MALLPLLLVNVCGQDSASSFDSELRGCARIRITRQGCLTTNCEMVSLSSFWSSRFSVKITRFDKHACETPWSMAFFLTILPHWLVSLALVTGCVVASIEAVPFL